ncbi:hypothetical protein FMEAI12_6160004 [Parafrankia sp. Ea1.12]|nr:hypothetical protein FMEAI12_6160004 [Parafrankia sp. Ea1.12]
MAVGDETRHGRDRGHRDHGGDPDGPFRPASGPPSLLRRTSVDHTDHLFSPSITAWNLSTQTIAHKTEVANGAYGSYAPWCRCGAPKGDRQVSLRNSAGVPVPATARGVSREPVRAS